MTKTVSGNVEAFHQRPLHNRYVCVYLDATYLAVRRDTVSKEAVYIAVGIREDGSKEVLERFLVTQFEGYNELFATRCHIGFNKARAELED